MTFYLHPFFLWFLLPERLHYIRLGLGTRPFRTIVDLLAAYTEL